MSKDSEYFLKTTDKRVHQQLDMLLTAMEFHSSCENNPNPIMSSASPKARAKFIKANLRGIYEVMGHKAGMIEGGLLDYVYDLYLHYLSTNQDLTTSLFDNQMKIAEKAALFLDAQFESEKIADVCSFLKLSAIDSTLSAQEKAILAEKKELKEQEKRNQKIDAYRQNQAESNPDGLLHLILWAAVIVAVVSCAAMLPAWFGIN